MKKKITSRTDIKFIISKFYTKLLNTDAISIFFEEFKQQDSLEKHLDVVTDFWEDILFQTYNYKNNPMQKHLDFNKKNNFNKEHFNLWLTYFSETVNHFYCGEKAETMITRAKSIATVMQLKMNIYKKS